MIIILAGVPRLGKSSVGKIISEKNITHICPLIVLYQHLIHYILN